MNVLKPSKDVNLGISQHDSRAAGVLNGELCLAVFASYAANGTCLAIPMHDTHIGNFKALNIKIIESQERDCIGRFKLAIVSENIRLTGASGREDQKIYLHPMQTL